MASKTVSIEIVDIGGYYNIYAWMKDIHKDYKWLQDLEQLTESDLRQIRDEIDTIINFEAKE